MKIKILIIAFPDSIHTARWISQLDKSKFEIHLFSSVLFREVHAGITNAVVHSIKQPGKKPDPAAVRIKYSGPAEAVMDLFPLIGKKLTMRYSLAVRKKALARLVEELKPDVIHTMESQQAGYLYGSISRQFDIPWVHSTWGIDLHFFKNIPAQRKHLQAMLSGVSLLVTEGKRDQLLARELGYTGPTTVIPSVGGGFNFHEFDLLDGQTLPSTRNKIIIKGYEGHERLASNVLLALQQLESQLQGFEIIVYSCSDQLLPLINKLRSRHNLAISTTTHTERSVILKMTSAARISITNNLSDGVPNTMLEAMALGAFPIQSDTAMTEDWIQDGMNGLITNPQSVESISQAIQKALLNNLMVDEAAIFNRRLVRQKLDLGSMKQAIENLYELAQRPARDLKSYN